MCELVSAATMASLTGAQAAAALTVLDAVSIIGTMTAAAGAYSAAKAQKDQNAYQASVARNNKIVADRQAEDIIKRGETEAQQKRSQVRQLQARQTVALAGQGVDVTEGSSVDLLADTAELGEFDAQVIRSNAAREAHAKQVQGYSFGTQSQLFEARAEAQRPAFAAGETLLTGFDRVSSRWYKRSIAS